VVDQWQLEEFAKVLRKVEVYLYATGIRDQDHNRALWTPIDSVKAGIKLALEKHGKNATIAVIPRGPYVLANIE